MSNRLGKPANLRKIDDFREASKLLFRYNDETSTICAAYNTISDKWREAFAMGFASHFLLDEIGQETEYMWEMVLAGKIFENAQYINNVYEMVDKTIFSRYAITKTDTASVRNDSGTSDVNVEHSSESTDNKNYSADKSGRSTSDDTYGEAVKSNRNVSNSLTTDVTDNGTSETASTDKETGGVTHTGNSKSDETRNDTEVVTVDSTGKTVTGVTRDVEQSKNGEGSKSGNSKTLPTEGEDTETRNSSSTKNDENTSNTTTNETKGSDTSFSATPQNGLSGVKSGKYLTNATVVDGTMNSTVGVTGTNTSNGTSDDTLTRKRGQGDDTTYTESSGYSETLTTHETSNTDESRNDNVNTDSTKNGSTGIVSTDSYTDDVDKTITGNSTVTDSKTSNTETSGTETSTDEGTKTSTGRNNREETFTDNGNETNTHTDRTTDSTTSRSDSTSGTAGETNVEHYEYSYETLRMAEPLLQNVWSLFDECFMGMA